MWTLLRGLSYWLCVTPSVPHVFAYFCEHSLHRATDLFTSLQPLYCSSEEPELPGPHQLGLSLTKVTTRVCVCVCVCITCVGEKKIRISKSIFLRLPSCSTWINTHMGTGPDVASELQFVLQVEPRGLVGRLAASINKRCQMLNRYPATAITHPHGIYLLEHN